MKLRGAIPVLATLFHDDETIDEQDLRRQVDFAIAAGAAAVCIPGFGSEWYKLSDPERYRVTGIVIE
jgi:2-keto-3-deoxy-L-arabinonate dehydratase